MSNKVTFVLDGRDIEARPGQSILEAADAAGIYIPRLCWHEDLTPGGHCRICSVKVNGKVTNACTMPVMDGMALAYRFGMTAPTYPYLSRAAAVDASHPDVFIDRNRCVLCGRCVRASRDRDHKGLFGFEGRGVSMRVVVDSLDGLGGTALVREDAAAAICPTGSIVVKRVGYDTPYGKRTYDKEPIGSDIEKKGS
jgi:[NiFe] hydrogenase diaphorase moiety small subunit